MVQTMTLALASMCQLIRSAPGSPPRSWFRWIPASRP